MKRKLLHIIIVTAVISTISNIIVIPSPITVGGICDFIGGWGRGKTSSCYCAGIKIVIDNSLPVDGNYETRCLGVGIKLHR